MFFLEKGAGCQEEGPVRRPFKPVVEVLELLLAVQKWELLSLIFEIFYILHFVQTVLLDAREAGEWRSEVGFSQCSSRIGIA